MRKKLILLDIDGTIADRDSIEVYPHALDFFARTSSDVAFVTDHKGVPPATTQGGILAQGSRLLSKWKPDSQLS